MSEWLAVGRGRVYRRHQVYWLYFREHGKRFQKNLGVTDVAEAVEKARLILGDGRSPVKTIDDAYKAYLKDYAERNRATSLQRVKDTLPAFLASSGVRFPHEINREHVKRFKAERMATCSPSTVNSDLSRIRAFCNWLRAEKLLQEDPTFKVGRLPEKGTRSARGLTEKEIEHQLGLLEGEGFYTDWYVVGLSVGLRPGEQGHIRSCDYEPESRVLHIHSWSHPELGEWELKTDESERSLKVTEAAHEILSRRKLAAGAPDALLFGSGAGTVRDVNNLRNCFLETFRRRLGVKKLPASFYYNLYSLRHTFGFSCVKAGWTLPKLSKYMGHSQIQTTMQYFRAGDVVEIGAPPVIVALRKVE